MDVRFLACPSGKRKLYSPARKHLETRRLSYRRSHDTRIELCSNHVVNQLRR